MAHDQGTKMESDLSFWFGRCGGRNAAQERQDHAYCWSCCWMFRAHSFVVAIETTMTETCSKRLEKSTSQLP